MAGVLIQDEKGDPAVILQSIPPGNGVTVHGKNGEKGKSVQMSVNEYDSAEVRVCDKEFKAQVAMGMTDRGGAVRVWSKEGKKGGLATMSITEHGGHVQAWDKERKGSAVMGTDSHGGFVSVRGNQDRPGIAAMNVNEYGNGEVSTFDKHGHRQ